jgi:flagellar hook-length control protein FliK
MSLILPSSSAPRSSSQAASTASARQDVAAENATGSFSEALSRSLKPAAPAGNKTDGQGDSKPSPVKRPADKPKNNAEDMLNTLALASVPLQSRSAPVALDSADAAATAAAASAGRSPAALLSGAGMSPPLLSTDVGTDAAVLAALSSASAAPDTALTPAQKTPATAADAAATVSLTPDAIAQQGAATHSNLRDEAGQRNDRPAIDPAELLKSKTQPGSDSSVAASTVPSSEATDSPTTSTALLGQAQAAVATSRPADVAAAASLAPGVGSPEWGKALGHQIIHMSQTASQVAELQLNPPGLGPLKITLSLNDQQMQATFVSAHESVRAAIEAALPQLRSTLADNGINLGNTSVNSGNQQQAAFNERPGEQPGPGSNRNPDGQSRPPAQEAPTDESTRLRRVGRMASGSGIDTYA